MFDVCCVFEFIMVSEWLLVVQDRLLMRLMLREIGWCLVVVRLRILSLEWLVMFYISVMCLLCGLMEKVLSLVLLCLVSSLKLLVMSLLVFDCFSESLLKVIRLWLVFEERQIMLLLCESLLLQFLGFLCGVSSSLVLVVMLCVQMLFELCFVSWLMSRIELFCDMLMMLLSFLFLKMWCFLFLLRLKRQLLSVVVECLLLLRVRV